MNLLPAHGPRCAHFAVVTVRVPRLNTKNLFRSKRRHGRASQFVLAESEGRSSVLFECKESGKLAAPIRARCRNFEIQNRARTIAFIQVRFGCLCRKLSRLYLSRHTQVAVDATRRTPWQCSRFVPPPTEARGSYWLRQENSTAIFKPSTPSSWKLRPSWNFIGLIDPVETETFHCPEKNNLP